MHLAPSLTDALAALGRPLSSLLDPSARVFGPFLLGAGCIAVVALVLRGLTLGAAARELLSPRVWLHRSALADLRLIAARAALRALLFGVRGVSTLVVAALVVSWLRRHLGLPGAHGPAALVGAAFMLSVFVAEDAARFYLHRLMHRVSWLWEFHKVHHSAEVLTPFTLYRTHPVEAAINGAGNTLAVGLVTGLFAWTFGPSIRAWEVLGVDALAFAWTLCGANLRHSHVWLSYGPRVERFLLSPAQHQVHHSTDPRHVDRNFGTALSLWDRLAGSLYVTTARPEALCFGLPAGEPGPSHTVGSLLLSPFAAVARRARAAVTPRPSPARPGLAPRFALAGATLVMSACTQEQPFDRGTLLQAFGRCTVQTYDQFLVATNHLLTAVDAYAGAPTDGNRTAARSAWMHSIDVWEQAEMLRYGPSAPFDTLGGQNLRESIYAWPDVNRCLIEQQVVSRAYERPDFSELSTSTRGLAAMEYLLFYEGIDNACQATDAINAMGTWAALTPDELRQRKAGYARAIAADVVAAARRIVTAWHPNGFQAQVETAGLGSTIFPTQQVAFSVIAEGAFYLDTDVKDLRLGRPLGIVNCPAGRCPEALESQWADRGREHLRNNLRGARLVLEGCAAGNNQGFDDRLEAAGAGALANQMRADLNAAEAAINAIPGTSLRQALASDPASLMRVHAAIKELTDFLKGEFSMTLQIVSTRVAGDND